MFDYVQRHAKSEFGLELRVDKCEVYLPAESRAAATEEQLQSMLRSCTDRGLRAVPRSIDSTQHAREGLLLSVEYLPSCTSHTHELRRVSPRPGEISPFLRFLSKSGIDVAETPLYSCVDRAC